MYYTSDQLDITEDDLTLDDIEGDEESDWLNHTDSNLSYEEVSLSNVDENDTTTAEGKHRNWSVKRRNTIIGYVYHWCPH